MCGIIGIINKNGKNIISSLLKGLYALEYRGYDSAGIAIKDNSDLKTIRSAGKVKKLDEKVNENSDLASSLGIAHTRWATHGSPSENNAHPHISENFAVVHNGIIENYLELREIVKKAGFKIITDTDTEVIPYLLEINLRETNDLKHALTKTFSMLEGAFALAIIYKPENKLIAVKKGSPLIFGLKDDIEDDQNYFVASDSVALSEFTNKIIYLEDNQFLIADEKQVEFYQLENDDILEIKPEIITLTNSFITSNKGEFKHYMLKEIHEQPTILGVCLKRYVNNKTNEILLNLADEIKDINKIYLVACGSSYFACKSAKYLAEKDININIETEIASEFRYRDLKIDNKSLCIFVSQSGETADTLASLEFAKKHKAKIIAITNVLNSSIARKADINLNIYAGPEIGVASTKAFTAQLLVLGLLMAHIAGKKQLPAKDLIKTPQIINDIINNLEENIKIIAKNLSNINTVIYLGRNFLYPIAKEGALKLKEISYIHAEAEAAGELKHGPIALIDDNVFIVALISSNNKVIFEKTLSTLQEVKARGGNLVIIADSEAEKSVKDLSEHILIAPKLDDFSLSIIYTIIVQLIAYHTAIFKGTDVDQPRNLAKSVTVE